MNQDTIQLLLIFTIIALAIALNVAVLTMRRTMEDTAAESPPEASNTPETEATPFIEFYASDDPESLQHVHRFIMWQTSVIAHALALVNMRTDPNADNESASITQEAFAIGMEIRRKCIGNRKTIAGQDQLQIIEATFRWCAEHIGIMEPQH